MKTIAFGDNFENPLIDLLPQMPECRETAKSTNQNPSRRQQPDETACEKGEDRLSGFANAVRPGVASGQ